jgi:catechol 2,3-dioxygenase-like lactoylglutathione lyase family enzyme
MKGERDMVARFDHVVIAVRDLDEGIRRDQALGFDVRPGGAHPGRGTHNALIRFGLDYIELIAMRDEAELVASGPAGAVLRDFLRERESGLVGYALATSDIEQDAERFRRAGISVEGPYAMRRVRPDGNVLNWRLLVPESVQWRRPWPFLIQWDTPDAQRLTWEQPGRCENTADGVVGLSVAVRDLPRAMSLYRDALGLELVERDTREDLAADCAAFQLGAFRVSLLAPAGAGPLQRILDDMGEGPCELALSVADIDEARRVVERAGVGVRAMAGAPATLQIALDPTRPPQIMLVGR